MPIFSFPKTRVHVRIFLIGLNRSFIKMRRLTILLAAIAASTFCALAVLAQTQAFSSNSVDYVLDLPSPTWRVVTEPDSVHEHAEFVNGERNAGYLRVRKEVVDSGTTARDFAHREMETKLHFLPGYVEGREESFAGRLNGVTISYEFTSGGKPMAGRIYYLMADERTIYSLRFTGLRDHLPQIRNQTDAIARSFHLK